MRPDISRPTSKPSRISSRFWTSFRRVVRESTVTGMPAFSASFRRWGFTSVITTWRAPANRATARRHNANRTRAGNQNVFPQHRKRKRRVDGVSEGIENRGNFVRDRARVFPDIHHRQDDIFRERAGAIHSHALRVRAKVTPPGEAIAAAPANDMPFPADQISGMKVRDVRSDLDNFAGKFVADDERHANCGLRPVIPIVDMQVGAANAGGQHANLDVVDAGFGLGNIFEPQSAFGAAFDEGFHSNVLQCKAGKVEAL